MKRDTWSRSVEMFIIRRCLVAIATFSEDLFRLICRCLKSRKHPSKPHPRNPYHPFQHQYCIADMSYPRIAIVARRSIRKNKVSTSRYGNGVHRQVSSVGDDLYKYTKQYTKYIY